MRHVFVGVCVLLAASGSVSGKDEVSAVIDKAIKAHNAEKQATQNAVRSKSKGTLELMGGLAFTQEVTVLMPDRFKEVMVLDIQGKEIPIITVYDGKKAWVSVMGETKELEGKILDEVKEAAHMIRVMRLTFAKDKGVEFAALGEVKVNDRTAVGVKVSSKGHRDLDVFFDKETGLVSKVVRRGVDPNSEQEFSEERIVREYQEIEGVKVAKKVVINRDGKKFLEVEVLEVKHPATIEESEFAKP